MSSPQPLAIAGIVFEPRAVLGDHRGAVLHHLRAGTPYLPTFGELYHSTVLHGVVKAWKRHQRVAQNLTVPVGRVRFVAYDDRPDSPTRGVVLERFLERAQHGLLHVPAGIWYGFRGEAPGESLLVNCVSEPHDPTETDRLPENAAEIPYRWPSA